MIATSSIHPQPPHLLSFPDMIRQQVPPKRERDQPPLPTSTSRFKVSQPARPPPSLPATTQPETSTGRIKGLFSRSRVLSPEPDPTIRSRLRSFIGENKAGPSRQTSTARNKRDDRTVGREPTQAAEPRAKSRQESTRPGFPDQTKRTNVRFGPSLLPAMQKGEDGKWQPPSLSRGSLSTSALALYANDQEGPDRIDGKREDAVQAKEMAASKYALSGLFHPRSRREPVQEEGISKIITTDYTDAPSLPKKDSNPPFASNRVTSGDGSGFSFQDIPPPQTTNWQPPAGMRTKAAPSPAKPIIRSSVPADQPKHSDEPISKRADFLGHASRSPGIRKSSSTPPSPLSQSIVTASVPALSKDHYHLRLATSYMIRVLTPFIRGSGFAVNDKNAEMKRKADDHISALGRMEKGWGGEWVKAAGTIGKDGPADAQSGGISEDKVRSSHVTERAKQRERGVWVEVIRDGILLCLLAQLYQGDRIRSLTTVC